jgi:ribosomal protein L40E
MTAKAALLAAVWWLTLWPIFFFTIWGLINWRRINRRVEEFEVERAVRAAASEPWSPDSALCRKCGYPNPSIALKCAHCGVQLRTIEVIHTWEQLPGAQESGPAVFYVGAVILSFFLGAGAVALVAPADPRLIDNDIVMVGTFLTAAFLTLVGAVEMMRRYVARRQAQGPRGRRTRS